MCRSCNQIVKLITSILLIVFLIRFLHIISANPIVTTYFASKSAVIKNISIFREVFCGTCSEAYACQQFCYKSVTYYSRCGWFGWGRCEQYRWLQYLDLLIYVKRNCKYHFTIVIILHFCIHYFMPPKRGM